MKPRESTVIDITTPKDLATTWVTRFCFTKMHQREYNIATNSVILTDIASPVAQVGGKDGCMWSWHRAQKKYVKVHPSDVATF